MFLPVTVPLESRETLQNVEDYRKLVDNCLSALLVLGQNKQVIKRADLNKLIYTRTRTQHHTVTKAVVDFANRDLNKYMAMRLYYMEDQKGYLLVNSTTLPDQCRDELGEDRREELAVIFLALMEIFSSPDETCSEAQIKETLRTLSDKEDDIKTQFHMLVRRLYIILDKNSSNQRETKLYKWGPRAIAEVDPDRFMKSFLELAEAGTVDDWPDQKRRMEALKAVPNRSLNN